MKSIFYLFTILLSLPCFAQNDLNAKDNNSKKYFVAYNVAVKDAAGKSNYEIFSMDADGSHKKNITNNGDVAWTYSAFEDRLFFISDRDTCYRCFFLYEMDVNGSKVKKIADLQLEDSWMDSRNNGKDLIVSGRKGKATRYQLFIVNTETGTYNQITNDTAAMYSDPVFSPDGKQIAFAYRKNKRDKTQNEELYIMNADGTASQQLTHYPQNDISRNGNGYKAGAAKWHPSENFISYISMQGGRHNIYAVTTDGKKQWKLTGNEFSEGYHDWSADGNWLVFDMTNQDETQYHIMLMNWKTKEVKQLTDTSHRYQQSPVFVEIKN